MKKKIILIAVVSTLLIAGIVAGVVLYANSNNENETKGPDPQTQVPEQEKEEDGFDKYVFNEEQFDESYRRIKRYTDLYWVENVLSDKKEVENLLARTNYLYGEETRIPDNIELTDDRKLLVCQFLSSKADRFPRMAEYAAGLIEKDASRLTPEYVEKVIANAPVIEETLDNGAIFRRLDMKYLFDEFSKITSPDYIMGFNHMSYTYYFDDSWTGGVSVLVFPKVVSCVCLSEYNETTGEYDRKVLFSSTEDLKDRIMEGWNDPPEDIAGHSVEKILSGLTFTDADYEWIMQ
jgi:hypothetical protein